MPTRPARALALPAAILTLSTALSGCAAFSDDSPAASSGAGGRLDVVAAFYPLQYAAQRVLGDRGEVVGLTRPGGEPHDLEITPAQTAEIVEADLVVHEEGFQPAVDDAVEQNAQGEVLDAARVVGLLPAAGEAEEGHAEEGHSEEGHAEEGHAEEGHAEEGHAEEGHSEEGHSEEGHSVDDGHDHDHGDLDPHFWQDPVRMAELSDAIAGKLADLDPDHAADYRSRAAALRSDLEALDTSYREGLASCERDTVVVSHDAFGYLAKYGLRMEPIAGLSPGAEPTPADLARLERLIGSDGITTVFSERLVSPRLSASLARDTGVRTAVLDPLEGLSDQTEGEDYLSLMEQNLAALQKANGCR